MQALNIILSTCSCRKLNKLSVVLMHNVIIQDYELILKQINVLVLNKCHLEKF